MHVGHPAEHRVGRHVVLETFFAGDNRAIARVFDGRGKRIAGQQVVGSGLMGAVRRGDGADDRELIHLLGEFRQLFAQLNARDIRPDRLEGAPNILGRVRLGIERVDMAWAAAQPDQNTGDVLLPTGRNLLYHTTGFRIGARLQQAGQSQAERCKSPDTHEVAP